MAKRFTDTELWDKEWFMQLKPKLKCLVKFVRDKSDLCGVWSPNWSITNSYIGEKVTEKDLLSIDGGQQFHKMANGKIFCIGFVEFQYGELSEKSPVHRKIISLLKQNNLLEKYKQIGYQHPIDRVQEKEEDTEEEKEEEKVKEQEPIYRSFAHLFLTVKDFNKLIKEGWTTEQVDSILDEIENYKDNKKYNSLLLTARNWLRRKKEQNGKQASTYKGTANERKASVAAVVDLADTILNGGTPDDSQGRNQQSIPPDLRITGSG